MTPGQPAAQHVHGGGLVAALPADEDRLAAQDGLAEDLEPLAAQGRPGLDDVGDDVGHAEGDRRLDRTVEADHLGADPLVGEVLLHQTGVARRHAVAGDLGDGRALPGLRGIPEGRGPKPSVMTSIAALPESSRRSRPVMPQSTVPEPT